MHLGASYLLCHTVSSFYITRVYFQIFARKEEGMSIHSTFSVNVIFGKRDEVLPVELVCKLNLGVLNELSFTKPLFLQPMLVACARQLIEHIR